MTKRKTQRRWNGAGDGLIHGYEIHVFISISPPQVVSTSTTSVQLRIGEERPRMTLLRTFCGLEMHRWNRGIWCRHHITCLECLVLAHRVPPRGMTEYAAAID